MNNRLKVHAQPDPYTSPWSRRERIAQFLWEYAWAIFCVWTPKPANRWRLLWLRLFGASIHGTPFVHQRARIEKPWNLVLHDHACLGDRAHAYSLDVITVGEHAIVAQEVYLCAGSHAFERPERNLVTGPIRIGAGVFIGARSLVLPGLIVGDFAIIGAGSVVTKDIPASSMAVGNPAKVRTHNIKRL